MSIHAPRLDFLTAIQKVGLSPGMKFCLDAGHELSLPAASTKWLDLSGNGEDFFRGTTAGAEGSDPTINGTPGRRSDGEYLSFDGGDSLLYDAANPAWLTNLHAPTGLGWFMCWFYGTTRPFGSRVTLFSSCRAAVSTRGITLGVSETTGTIAIFMGNGSGTIALNSGFGASTGVATPYTENAWNFMSVGWNNNNIALGDGSFADAGMNSIVRDSGTIVNTAALSASAPTDTMRIGVTNGDPALPNGFRIAAMAVGEGVKMTNAQHLAIFNKTRSKFGV